MLQYTVLWSDCSPPVGHHVFFLYRALLIYLYLNVWIVQDGLKPVVASDFYAVYRYELAFQNPTFSFGYLL